MACVPELFISLRQGNRWRQVMINDAKMDLDTHAGSREDVPAPMTKGGGWRLIQPRGYEGNDNFTTQRAIPCHINF